MKLDLTNHMICGVCSGIAKQFGISANLIRAAFVIFTLLGFGLPVILYIVLALLLPAETGEQK